MGRSHVPGVVARAPVLMARLAFLSHYDFNLYRFRLPIMKAALRGGHDVYAVSPPGEFSDRFASEGIIHRPYRLKRRSVNPLREARVLAGLTHALREIRPDLLHTFTVKPNVYGSIAARAAGVPVVVNSVTGLGSWNLGRSRGVVWPLFALLYGFAFRRSGAVVFQNDDDRSEFERRGLVRPGQAVTIRGSGVDLTVFHPVDRGGRDGVTVAMVARLIRDKGVPEYLEAARRVREHLGSRVRFRLIGTVDEGNRRSLSWEEVRRLAGSEVELLGERDDVPRLLAESDIYVLPSHREGLPMSVLEAMASGLPIVTTDAPGCRDTVEEGVNGFLVPVGRAEPLTRAIETLAESGELRGRLGAASRRRAQELFSVERVVAAHLALYARLLNASRADG